MGFFETALCQLNSHRPLTAGNTVSLASSISISKGFRWTSVRWSRQRWLSPLAVLLLWELGARTGLIPSRILAAPSSVAATFWAMTVSGELPANVAVSVARAGAGC